MAYSLSVDINLGAANSGLTLTSALFDSANVAAGGLTTSTMVEVAAGSGSYLWTGTVPDGHRGYIAFSSGATFKTKVVLNPQEVEFPDQKTSSLDSAGIARQGTAQAGSVSTITLDAGASAVTNYYVGLHVRLKSGTGAGQTRTITAYSSSTKIATVDWNWETAPDSTSVFVLYAANAPALDSSLSVGIQSGTGANQMALTSGQVQIQPIHRFSGHSGVVVAAGTDATHLQLATTASGTNDYYKGQVVWIYNGAGQHQSRVVTAYVGATKIATLDRAWVGLPDGTSSYYIGSVPGARLDTNLDVAVGALAADVITAVSMNTDASDEIAAKILVTPANKLATASGGNPILRTSESGMIRSATAQAGGATTITLDAGADANNDAYKGCRIFVHSGTGQLLGARIVTAYNGTTKVATVNRAWVTNPDNTSVFAIHASEQPALNSLLEVAASAVSSFGSLAAQIWSYATRTLTTMPEGPLVVAPSPLSAGGRLPILRGDTLTFTVTGLGDLTGRTKLWWTLKADVGDADTAALVQIEETAGLVTINGTAGTAGNGMLTVTDMAAGDISVTLAAVEVAKLAVAFNDVWDVQILAGTVRTLALGPAIVTADATRRTS